VLNLPIWSVYSRENRLTKIIVATGSRPLKQKCTKFNFGWGSAPDPAE